MATPRSSMNTDSEWTGGEVYDDNNRIDVYGIQTECNNLKTKANILMTAGAGGRMADLNKIANKLKGENVLIVNNRTYDEKINLLKEELIEKGKELDDLATSISRKAYEQNQAEANKYAEYRRWERQIDKERKEAAEKAATVNSTTYL